MENEPHGARIMDIDILKDQLQKCQFCFQGSSFYLQVVDVKLSTHIQIMTVFVLLTKKM